MRANKPLLHGEITASIIDSFIDVHNELGYGFREYIYGRALERLLIAKGHKVEREVERNRASIACSSRIGSNNETSSRRSRCRAVSVVPFNAVAQECCL